MHSTKPGWLTAHLPTLLPERIERPSKEMVLRWIDRAWREIPVDLIMRSFKSCGINNALDGIEDDLVWDDHEEEEAEDEEAPSDNEFENDE